MSADVRFEVLPWSGDQVLFLVDGVEKLRWHFAASAPRPYFFPFCGPANVSLTRMGHPGAPNHDHHRSIWFAHAQVTGVDFWSDTTSARIRQREWLCYQHGPEACQMAVLLDWLDGHDPAPLLTQTLLANVSLHADGGTLLELQSDFVPTSGQLELRQSNFGMLAIRVARELSAYFGSGEIRDSQGRAGEPEIFGKAAEWMDYAGPLSVGTGPERQQVVEGITCYDHPDNPHFPAAWHVREDGWMGPSLTREHPVLITPEAPLRIRYLLHAHPGLPDGKTQSQLARHFANLPPWEVRKSTRKHTFWEAVRQS